MDTEAENPSNWKNWNYVFKTEVINVKLKLKSHWLAARHAKIRTDFTPNTQTGARPLHLKKIRLVPRCMPPEHHSCTNSLSCCSCTDGLQWHRCTEQLGQEISCHLPPTVTHPYINNLTHTNILLHNYHHHHHHHWWYKHESTAIHLLCRQWN